MISRKLSCCFYTALERKIRKRRPRGADSRAVGPRRDSRREEVRHESSECANPEHLAIVDQHGWELSRRYQRRIAISTIFKPL